MTDEFKKKAEQTCLEKYGVRNVLCAGTEQRLKAEHTKIERYGDKNYNNKEQTARTCQ